jgi:hypothetical protein
MAATAAHLMEDVLPAAVPLRQWVLTVPFALRKRLGYDGRLLSALTRLFVKTVLDFYRDLRIPHAGIDLHGHFTGEQSGGNLGGFAFGERAQRGELVRLIPGVVVKSDVRQFRSPTFRA